MSTIVPPTPRVAAEPRFDQLREVAMEACLIRMTVAVAGEIEALKLTTDEARRLARFELGRYAAHALMMPYQPFHAAAHRAWCRWSQTQRSRGRG